MSTAQMRLAWRSTTLRTDKFIFVRSSSAWLTSEPSPLLKGFILLKSSIPVPLNLLPWSKNCWKSSGMSASSLWSVCYLMRLKATSSTQRDQIKTVTILTINSLPTLPSMPWCSTCKTVVSASSTMTVST